MKDKELAKTMRPWNWFYGSLAVILITANVLYWLPAARS